jgi:hypothetical protein
MDDVDKDDDDLDRVQIAQRAWVTGVEVKNCHMVEFPVSPRRAVMI